MEQHQRAVGAFARHTDTKLALTELQQANFPMDKVSVIAKDAKNKDDIAGVEVKEHIGNKADEGAVAGAVAGGTVGGVTGLLVGLGLLAIPGIGPIMLAGAEATAIASALAGGAIGTAAGSLTGALIGLGIPDDKAKVYSDLVDNGYYLIIVNGDSREIAIAEMILRNRGIEHWDTFHPVPSANANNSSATLNGRYKYAVGHFFLRQDAEKAVTELRMNDFPMQNVSIFAKPSVGVSEIHEIPITTSNYDFAVLEIPHHQIENYQRRVELGDYLLALHGTDIQLAAAQNILQRNGIQNYEVFTPKVTNQTAPAGTI
ncbi:hypothetical protein [Calothrix sp. NIES-3974]|uniref:hypothetical protein n=1 Tax=Calothrix sp. NIES-3974 TaxID=2005462 RepID=UPI000B6001F0|nr:hypothetical protein [Calothrix sp. NIES-3974]BAZ03428.1 hypothetical protein NIES3974_00540 [Calothrix sp. NIES-3974]